MDPIVLRYLIYCYYAEVHHTSVIISSILNNEPSLLLICSKKESVCKKRRRAMRGEKKTIENGKGEHEKVRKEESESRSDSEQIFDTVCRLFYNKLCPSLRLLSVLCNIGRVNEHTFCVPGVGIANGSRLSTPGYVCT
jgi:hypothetical protein